MALARETKVGLVVAASFLSLVGVVVAARLRNSQEPQTQETKITPNRQLAQADTKEKKKNPGTGGVDPGKGTPAASTSPVPQQFPLSVNEPPATDPSRPAGDGGVVTIPVLPNAPGTNPAPSAPTIADDP